MTQSVTFLAAPGGRLAATLRVPGDKSISHRVAMLGSLADGVTRARGFLEGKDCLATLDAFRAMGVKIEGPSNGEVSIHGVGVDGLKRPASVLDMGNSGTSMRLLAGLLAGQSFDTTLTGDQSLMARPMRRIIEPLQKMQGSVAASDDGTAPLRVTGGADLRAIEYALPLASAQVKSCVLLAGLYARGKTCVTEPSPTRDHTERMLRSFGYQVEHPAGNKVCLQGGGRLTATEVDVPADISSAAFFMVGASIADGSDIVLPHVGVNPARTGVIDILRLMGADITIDNRRQAGAEPVADIRVRAPSRLQGIHVPERLIPPAIDELPAIFVAAACATGETIVSGAAELRVKESDRIAAMAAGLNSLGVPAEPTEDGIVIQGKGGFTGGSVETHGDHRIAMSFAIAALRAAGDIRINHCANVDTSFPGFVDMAAGAGLRLRVI